MLMAAVEVLLRALIVALSAAGLVPLLRAAPIIRSWVAQGRKPWACDICLSMWTTLAMGLAWWAHQGAPLLGCVPAYALVLYLVRRNSDPLSRPPVPELRDLEVEEEEVPFMPPQKRPLEGDRPGF